MQVDYAYALLRRSDDSNATSTVPASTSTTTSTVEQYQVPVRNRTAVGHTREDDRLLFSTLSSYRYYGTRLLYY